ncbi:MAG: hypothetical protein AAF297_07815 [Planctomycetota bacterium]
MRTALIASVAALALVLPACSSTETADTAQTAELVSTEPINTICPLGGHEIPTEGALTTVYEGYTVGFCCEGCAEAWPQETEESRQEMLAAMLEARGD